MSIGDEDPPVSGEPKKRKSEKKKGRPPKSTMVSPAILFRKVSDELVPIKRHGKQVKMTQLEATVRAVHTLALNKDPAASRLFHKMRKTFPGSAAPGGKYLIVVSDADLKV
jgi:hypothetical protein